jgi:hypothetical protein
MATKYSKHVVLATRVLAVIFATSFFDAVCFARLGETEAQVRDRYGKGTNFDDADNAWDDKTLLFFVPGPAGGEIRVWVYLVDGVSVAENYAFYSRDASECPIEGDVYEAAKAIINANSQGHQWRGLPGLPPPGIEILWVRSDNQLNTAVVWKNAMHVLEVSTAESHRKAEQHKKGLKGF